MSSRAHDELVAHLVWAVKNRRPLLEEAGDPERIALFGAKCSDLGALLLAAGCAADHVHVLVRFPAARSLSEVVQRLKGASSRAHNLSNPNSAFAWQDGFWARSCNPNDLAEITLYIQRQREHHQLQREPELWETALPTED